AQRPKDLAFDADADEVTASGELTAEELMASPNDIAASGVGANGSNGDPPERSPAVSIPTITANLGGVITSAVGVGEPRAADDALGSNDFIVDEDDETGVQLLSEDAHGAARPTSDDDVLIADDLGDSSATLPPGEDEN
ncbi:MAG TPA: hypothetical protein VM580_15105, partial [Labilithrix sp.]|nr:hypothetical protein [Labilithrix sp.]